MRAGNLSEEQLKTIKSVDKVRKEQRKQTIESNPGTYATLLAGGENNPSVLEKASKRPDITQYILVLATDLISGQSHFSRASRVNILTTLCRCSGVSQHDFGTI